MKGMKVFIMIIILRFADILGLDLSEVKTFVDEIPCVPKAAYADLDVSLSDIEVGSPVVTASRFPQPATVTVSSAMTSATTSLVPMFTQPGGSSTFLDTVLAQKISLENAFMEGPSTVFGIVRVLNISFHKVQCCKRLIGEVVQSRRRSLLGPSPG